MRRRLWVMTTLPLRARTASIRCGFGRVSLLIEERSQARGSITATSALIVAPHHGGDMARVQTTFGREVLEQQFDQSRQRDAVTLPFVRDEPRCETAELGKGGWRRLRGRGSRLCGSERLVESGLVA